MIWYNCLSMYIKLTYSITQVSCWCNSSFPWFTLYSNFNTLNNSTLVLETVLSCLWQSKLSRLYCVSKVDLFWQRLREHQQELNQFRLSKENEVNNKREEFEAFKRELQTQLRYNIVSRITDKVHGWVVRNREIIYHHKYFQFYQAIKRVKVCWCPWGWKFQCSSFILSRLNSLYFHIWCYCFRPKECFHY